MMPGITRKFAGETVGPCVALSCGMRTDASCRPHTSTAAAALCLACHGPLETDRQTVLDRYEVELWWCRDCNTWWGNGSSQDDANDRAVFCRTHPVALAARVDRLTSIEPLPIRRRA